MAQPTATNRPVTRDENTSLHPAGPGNWNYRSMIECSDCGSTLGLDDHPTVRCSWVTRRVPNHTGTGAVGTFSKNP